MDGSEPGETVPAAILSGAPTDLQARTVRYDRSRVQEHTSFSCELTTRFAESTAPRSLLHSPETGTATTGGWIGIFCKGVTGGKTRLWVGSRLQMACRVPT